MKTNMFLKPPTEGWRISRIGPCYSHLRSLAGSRNLRKNARAAIELDLKLFFLGMESTKGLDVSGGLTISSLISCLVCHLLTLTALVRVISACW